MTRRTKHSVEAGIKWTSSAGTTTTVEYQPGNGSRYLIALTDLRGMGARGLEGMGFEAGAPVVLVSWLNAGKCWAMRDDRCYLEASYLAEKLRCSVDDGAVLAELVAHFTNRQAAKASERRDHAHESLVDAVAKSALDRTALPLCQRCGGSGEVRIEELRPERVPCPECQGEGVRRASS